MNELRTWWHHFATLVTSTLGVWWRLLPWLLTIQIIGYTVVEVALAGAPFISAQHPWLALLIISTALLVRLTAAVICLRLIGQALGMDQMLGLTRQETSLSSVLGITLLPFLGIYSVFGQVQQLGGQLLVYEVITRGFGERSVLATLSPVNAHQTWVLVGVIVGTYVLRRALDLLHDKTDWRPLGYLAAWVEAFFMLVFLFAGTRLLARGVAWLGESRLGGWVSELRAGWHTSAARIADQLPTTVDWAWHQLSGNLWPLLISALAEPVLWLAVAALIFGTRAVSLGEIWRRGEPSSAAPVPTKQAPRKTTSSARRVVLELQESLFGDLDDKYLPAWLSVRLILRGGVLFLGAYVLGYALFSSAEQVIYTGFHAWFGPQDSVFWVRWLKTMNLVAVPLSETLRLSLLGVAATYVLGRFRAGADPTELPRAPGLESVPPSEPPATTVRARMPLPGSLPAGGGR